MLGGPIFKSHPAVLVFDPKSTFGIWEDLESFPLLALLRFIGNSTPILTLPLRCRVLVEGTIIPLSLLGFFQYGISKKIFHNQF